MKVTKEISHTVNLGNYESMKFTASVEMNTDGMSTSEMEALPMEMTSIIEQILTPEIDTALELAPNQSHIHDVYQQEK